MITSQALPSLSILRPGIRMLEVGLRAMWAIISWPLEIPPRMPPAWLERNPSGVISSRCSVPFCATEAKPSPISTPLTALMLISACARSASKRSKIGSPKPTGTPDATTEILAPTELPSLRNASMYSAICSAAAASGEKNGLLATSSQLKFAGSIAIGPS